MNGGITLPSVSGRFDETGVVNFAFNIEKTGQPAIGAFFESARFENQAAEIHWNDGIKTGSITVTGIPKEYSAAIQTFAGRQEGLLHDTAAKTFVAYESAKKMSVSFPSLNGAIAQGTTMTTIIDGSFSQTVWSAANNAWKPYTETGPKDVANLIREMQRGDPPLANLELRVAMNFVDSKATWNFADYFKAKRQPDGMVKITKR